MTKTIDFDDILEGAARALFVSAYADAADEAEAEGEDFDGDTAGPGEDWDDVAPDTPQTAMDSAALLLARTAGLVVSTYDYPVNEPTDSIICGLCKDWIECGGGCKQEDSPEQVFGYYLAMQALGHGVGLSDDTVLSYLSPTLPHWDGYYFGGEFYYSAGTASPA